MLNVLAAGRLPHGNDLSALAGQGFPRRDFVDVIYSSGNGLCAVDDDWFAHAVAMVLGRAAPCSARPEEMIWQKASSWSASFDGADVAHLLRARGPTLNWHRLLRPFRAALAAPARPSHPVRLRISRRAGQVYSRAACSTRSWSAGGKRRTAPIRRKRFAEGTLLSRMQYLTDTERWGYKDPRLSPPGDMTAEQITHWTAAGR